MDTFDEQTQSWELFPVLEDLSRHGEEIPEELLDLVAGGRMVVWPTYCKHSDPPHICDHEFF